MMFAIPNSFSGQQISNTQKGINIVDGKKVMVK